MDKKEIAAAEVGTESERLGGPQQPTEFADDDPDAWELGFAPHRPAPSMSLN